jgi:hypothetical protein
MSSHISSPTLSLIPGLASSYFGGAAVHTESHNLEHTVSEAAMREMVAL